MKTVSTTNVRKEISRMVSHVRETGAVFAIGRRDVPEALLIKYPTDYTSEVSDITNINTYSDSFNFLTDEPDLYTIDDLKKKYA